MSTLLKQQPRSNIQMLCYKDKTWCSISHECGNLNCGRNLSQDEINNAVEWWGGLDFPVAYMYYKTEECGYISTEMSPVETKRLIDE